MCKLRRIMRHVNFDALNRAIKRQETSRSCSSNKSLFAHVCPFSSKKSIVSFPNWLQPPQPHESLFVMRFYGLVNTIKVMSGMSVNPIMLGKCRPPKRLTSTFTSNSQLSFLNQRGTRMTIEIISRKLFGQAGARTNDPWICSQTCCRMHCITEPIPPIVEPPWRI